MAKRKAKDTPDTSIPSKKRLKGTASKHAHGSIDPEREYKVKSIVGEDKTRYLISWEDDEETGETFSNTWEPKANANADAIEDWEAQKAEKKQLKPRRERRGGSRSASISSASQLGSPRRTTSPPKRPRRIIESSPLVEASTKSNGHRNLDQTDEILEIEESQQTQNTSPQQPEQPNHPSPLFVSEESDSDAALKRPPSAAVRLSEPSSSYLAGEYQKVTSSQVPSSGQHAATQPSAEPSQYLPGPQDTSDTTGNINNESTLAPVTPSQQAPSLPASAGHSSTRVVPDSQSIVGSTSYQPRNSTIASSSALQPSQPPASGEESTLSPPEDQVQSAGAVRLPKSPDQLLATQLSSRTAEPTNSTTGISSSNNATQNVQQAPGPISNEKESQRASNPKSPSVTQSPEGERQSRIPKTSGEEAQRSDHEASSNELEGVRQSREFGRATASQGTTESQQLADEIASVINSTESANLGDSPAPNSGSADANPTLQSQARQVSTHLDSPTQSASQGENLQGKVDPSLPSQGIAVEQTSSSERHQPLRLTPIDLTNTQHQSTFSKFTVTPPHQLSAESQAYRVPDSTINSSLLLQTQLSRPSTEGRNTIITSLPASQHDNQGGDSLLSANRAISLPAEQISALFSSSPIIAPPSQPIEPRTPGVSAPPRPLTISSPSAANPSSRPMATQPDLLTRLREMRARHRSAGGAARSEGALSATPEPFSKAKQPIFETGAAVKPTPQPALAAAFKFDPNRGRSPSAVPAEQPLPVITLEEMTTSGRYETLLPQSQADTDADAQQNGALVAKRLSPRPSMLKRDPKLADVHAIPIYLVGTQRDEYSNMVKCHRETFQRFLASISPNRILTEEVMHALQRIRRMALHPDLDNAETYTQYDVRPFEQADWDMRSSAKFRFLKDLLCALKGETLRIAVLAQPGRIMEILETFLKGIDVSYERIGKGPDLQEDDSGSNGALKVLLSETDSESTVNLPVDLVIAMTNHARHDTAQVHSLRSNGSKCAPFITLIVPRSVEHVEQSLSSTISDSIRLRSLVSGTYQYKDEAGKSQEPESHTSVAILLAQYMKGSLEGRAWPLPILHDLQDLDSQTDSEFEVASSSLQMEKSTSVGEKRSREPDDALMNETVSNKRSRIGSPDVEEADITHISDSIGKATQCNIGGQEVNSSSPVLSAVEKRLQNMLIEKQNQLDEHVKVLADLQYRFEEQRTQLIEVTTERDSAIATAQQAISRLSEESNRMSTLRAENSTLKEALQGANGKLLDHAVPERAAFEALRLVGEQAKANKEKAEKRLEQSSKDIALVRDLYQDLSNSAQTSSARVVELENELAIAKNRATGEQAKLRQMSYDEFTQNTRDENKRLKARLKELDAGLRFRDEEIARLKEASRGRMGTRGTSLPRSPRLDSPKPGSRQTSPATGELKARSGILHPLRNG